MAGWDKLRVTEVTYSNLIGAIVILNEVKNLKLSFYEKHKSEILRSPN